MKIIQSSLIILIFISQILAQDDPLEAYIEEALYSNLSLKQKDADYRQSLESLKSARALFFPDISLNSRYTLAQGGRLIEFPVGDMLNPVYASLNGLTGSEFPELENQEFAFYRPTEQETSLDLLQPLINPEIIYNHRIEKKKLTLEKITTDIYRREVIKEVKIAYYNYLRSVYLMKLVDDTEKLLQENIKVSNSLYKNDKVTLDVVYRSNSEYQGLIQKMAEAEKGIQTARAYFNFLLNRPLESEIKSQDYKKLPDLVINTEIAEALTTSAKMREEFKQLELYAAINHDYTQLLRSNNYPSLSLAIKYGFQGEAYSFTSQDDFMLASAVLRWNLFQGFKNRADIQKAKIAGEQITMQQEEVSKKIELQVIQAYYDLIAVHKSVIAAQAQKEASDKAFKVSEEKYRIGQLMLIEYIDARTSLTQSSQNLILAVFEFKIKEAELERAMANQPIY